MHHTTDFDVFMHCTQTTRCQLAYLVHVLVVVVHEAHGKITGSQI